MVPVFEGDVDACKAFVQVHKPRYYAIEDGTQTVDEGGYLFGPHAEDFKPLTPAEGGDA